MPCAATLLILSATPVADSVRSALCASAERLGHGVAPCFTALAEADDIELLVHEVDPWAVVAIDDASVEGLRTAFSEAAELAADNPVAARA